jgi:hypothetical protein
MREAAPKQPIALEVGTTVLITNLPMMPIFVIVG